MIQRIQSLFLLIAFLLCAFLLFADPSILTVTQNNEITKVAYVHNYVGNIHHLKTANLLILIALGGTSLFIIFLYKKQEMQKRMCNYLILLSLIFTFVLVVDYVTLKNQLTTTTAYPGFHVIWIIAIIVMLVMARIKIARDIKLLASMDRLR